MHIWTPIPPSQKQFREVVKSTSVCFIGRLMNDCPSRRPECYSITILESRRGTFPIIYPSKFFTYFPACINKRIKCCLSLSNTFMSALFPIDQKQNSRTAAFQYLTFNGVGEMAQFDVYLFNAETCIQYGMARQSPTYTDVSVQLCIQEVGKFSFPKTVSRVFLVCLEFSKFSDLKTPFQGQCVKWLRVQS